MASNVGKISLNASVQNLSFKITGSNTITINFGSESKSYNLSDKETVVEYTFDDATAKDITITNAAYIKSLDVSKNSVNTIQFESCVQLNKFIGYNNNIQSLDFTNCDVLQYVHIQNNPMCTDKEKMTNMINTLTDRNQRAFGSIVMYDFVPPKDFDTMDEDKRSIRELRKELEKVSIPKDWYFGSAIIYDEVEFKKLTDSVLMSNAVDIWESAEYGEGLVYADMYNVYIMNETPEWDQSIFLKKYDIADGTFDIVDSTQTDETAKSYDSGHGTSVTSILMSQGNKMYGLIPKAKVVGIYGGKNRPDNKIIQKKSIDKLNDLEKLDFIVQTTTLRIDQNIGLYPEYDNAVHSLLDKYKAIWFASNANNGDSDDETIDKISYAPYAHLVSGSHLNIDTQTFAGFKDTGPGTNSEYIKFSGMFLYSNILQLKDGSIIYKWDSGTSYSTPYTAGVYGLLKILYEKKYKDYTLENLERYAYNHARPLIYNVKQNSGYGILNCMYFHDTSIDTAISSIEKLEDTIDLQYTNNLNSVLKIIPENTTNKKFHLAKKYPQDIIIDDTNTIYPLKNDGSTVSKKLYSSSDNTKFETINIKFPNNKKYDEITDGLVFSFSSENTDFRDGVSGKQLVKTGNVTFDGKKIKFEANSGLVLNDFVMEDQITIQFCVGNLDTIKTNEYPVYLYNNALNAKEKIVYCIQLSTKAIARQFGGPNGNMISNTGIYIESPEYSNFTVITMTIDFNNGVIAEYVSGVPYNSDKITQVDSQLDYFRTIKKVNTLVIGNKSTLTGGGCVNTDLYGVRIFNRVLSQREVIQNTSALMMNAQVDESLIPDNSYKGTVSLIAGIGQANGQKFALMDGAAVQYKTEVKNDGSFKSVTDKIEEIEVNNNLFGNITNEEIQNIMSTVFNSAILLPGSDFNKMIKTVVKYPKQLIFTKTAIPGDKISSATIVSTEDSPNKVYAYANDTTICVSPEKDNVIMYCNENSKFMFSSSPGSLDLTILNTSNVTNMSNMFGSRSLKSVNITGWDTSNVTDMSSMFDSESLTTITGIEDLDTSKVTNMNSMFSGCNRLTSLYLTGWDTSNVTDMSNMFDSCDRLTSLDLSGWDTSKVTKMFDMFSGCDRLTSLDLTGWDTSNVTDMSSMFDYCTNLTTITGLENFNTSKVTNMNGMFKYSKKLTTLDLSKWDTSNVTDIDSMFEYCSSLTTITGLENFNTSNITSMKRVFCNPSKLTTLDLSKWDVSKVSNMDSIFSSNNSTTINITGWDTSNVTNMSNMFNDCTNLTTIIGLEDLDTSNITSMSNMFVYCNNLTSINVSKLDTSKVIYMTNMFKGCTNLTTIIGLENFNTSKVTDMNNMFSGCTSLTSLNLTGWDTSNVTDMNSMFKGCTNLTTIIGLEGLDTSSITDVNTMFNNCNKLTSNILIRYNISTSSKYENMFNGCSTEPGSSFVVNYIESTQATAERIVSTKSENSNVTLGSLVS